MIEIKYDVIVVLLIVGAVALIALAFVAMVDGLAALISRGDTRR